MSSCLLATFTFVLLTPKAQLIVWWWQLDLLLTPLFEVTCKVRIIFRRDASLNREPISYGNVAGWLAGWVAVCHSRYCIKTTKPILKLFRPSGSPIIEAFGTSYADTKFQGEPLHRGRLIHGGRKNWRFSTEMADISETVRDRTMVTIER